MWLTLVPIIVQYGLPIAEKLAGLISANQPPSEADWASLRDLTAQKAKDKATEVLARHNIDPNSDLAKSILELTA